MISRPYDRISSSRSFKKRFKNTNSHTLTSRRIKERAVRQLGEGRLAVGTNEKVRLADELA
jgi:hypothetical protein